LIKIVLLSVDKYHFVGIPTKEALSSSFSGPKTDPLMGAKKKSGSLKVGIKKVRASFNAAKEAVIDMLANRVNIISTQLISDYS